MLRKTLLACIIVLVAFAGVTLRQSSGAAPVAGFTDRTVFTGLVAPTNVAFAPGGRVFIAEKRGVIKVYDSLSDTTPTIFADLRTEVYNFWDRGLSGLAVHPQFPSVPYVYAAYSYDFDPRTPTLFPRWGTSGVDSDPCPSPPGATGSGCIGSGRVVRLTASGSIAVEQTVLIEDYCIQFPTHSVDELRFGPDGQLYVSAGDGAHFALVDVGQRGDNPCGDPIGEGGALRAQDALTPADPQTLDGTILRIDPLTGAGSPGNPFADSTDANLRRVAAFGVRNPYRFAFHPVNGELFVGDVGMAEFEEITRIDVRDGAADNLGWPCFEGTAQHAGYAARAPLCGSLYSGASPVVAPFFEYRHDTATVDGDGCARNGASITGVAFEHGANFPSAYNTALFFADYSRECIWAMPAGADGQPDPSRVRVFANGLAGPVDLEFGPDGALYYVALNTGELHRIAFDGPNTRPVAAVSASVGEGAAPLTVTLSAAASYDPEGTPLAYSWDVDGDGQFGDAVGPAATVTYRTGAYLPRVRVTDALGASSTTATPVQAGLEPLADVGFAGWQFNGAAVASECGVRLTPAAPVQRGSVVSNRVVPSSNIAVSFDAVVSGNGGDGLALALIDASEGAGALGYEGGNVGFGGLSGVAVVLDTFRNPSDAYSNFVGLATGVRSDGGLDYAVTNSAVKPLANSTTRVDVIVGDEGRIAVFIDGVLALNAAAVLPPLVRVAFTSATGGAASAHSVCNGTVSVLPAVTGSADITPGVDFGGVAIGQAEAASIKVRNLGTTSMTVASVSVPAAPFLVTNAPEPGVLLQPGQTLIMTLMFNPGAESVEASMLALSFEGGLTLASTLRGEGIDTRPPLPTIVQPTAELGYLIDGVVQFRGLALRANGARLPAAALSWAAVIKHCAGPTLCHEHVLQTFEGIESGSFTAPDHGAEITIELRLTATDRAASATTTVELHERRPG